MATDMGPGQWTRRIMHGSRLVCREDAAVAHGALFVESVHRVYWLTGYCLTHAHIWAERKLNETVEWVYMNKQIAHGTEPYRWMHNRVDNSGIYCRKREDKLGIIMALRGLGSISPA